MNENLKANNNYLYNVALNHMIGLNLDKRYKRLVKRSLLEMFLNKFRDNKQENKQRQIVDINLTEAQKYIDDKIDELGNVSKNNYKLVFWKELKKCEEWFQNISRQKI